MADQIESLRFKFLYLKEEGLKAIRAASRKAGMLIRDEASRLAPRRRGVGGGALAAGILLRTRKESDESIELEIKPSSKTAWYSRFVIAGTKPHIIQPRKKKALARVGGFEANSGVHLSATFFGRRVQHPGIKPTPFLAQARENKGDEAATVYWVEFNKGIEKRWEKAVA